jgi:PAS domain S-box-containing protein
MDDTLESRRVTTRPDADVRLAAIVESSDDAIVSKDLDGIITSWNRAAERMFGYTAAEVIGQSITIIVPVDRLSEETHVLSQVRAGNMVDHFETIRRRKDGIMIPISLTVSPIRNAAGTIIGASKIARDISERRAAEQALAAAEARQRDLQQRLVALVGASSTLFRSPRLDDVEPAILALGRTLIAADAYAVWRFDAATALWRLAASQGLSERFTAESIGAARGTPVPPLDFSEPLVADRIEDAPILAERVAALKAEGLESMLAVPLVVSGHATGTMVFYSRRPHVFTQVEVQIARAIGDLGSAAVTTARLYDEQRRMRERAERATRQAAFLAEASAALAASLDYETTLKTVAQLAVPQIVDWCGVTIVTESGEIRRLAVAHSDPAREEEAKAFLDRYPLGSDSPASATHAIRTGESTLIPEVTDEMLAGAARDAGHLQALRSLGLRSLIVAPLRAHRGTVGALTFVTADSGRRFSEADLQFAQDVAYRAALAVENARAHRQAYAANRAKDEFLATLSHELRTPLNAVLGWVRMLRAGSLSAPKRDRAFEVIERNAIAQQHLVEDLLDLSRIITGKFKLDIQPLDLAATIQAAVESIQPAAAAKAIAIVLDLPDADERVTGDRSRLQQVVWNLLSNAIKFTPRGGEVAVMLQYGADQVEIDVSDTGEGIDPEVLPFVFDRFRQGDSGTTRTHMGLGLGLAIVRHIVELHGGNVGVTSAGRGKGSTFRIALPMGVARAVAVAIPGRDVFFAPPPPPSSTLSGLRAMVVDDDADARELLAEVLRSRGVEVTVAASVDEAIAALDREVPDILLSDMAMPDRDGFDLIHAVRSRAPDRGGDVPAVAITAYARAEDSERAVASGFQVHLAKPVDLDRLLETVASLTGRNSETF